MEHGMEHPSIVLDAVFVVSRGNWNFWSVRSRRKIRGTVNREGTTERFQSWQRSRFPIETTLFDFQPHRPFDDRSVCLHEGKSVHVEGRSTLDAGFIELRNAPRKAVDQVLCLTGHLSPWREERRRRLLPGGWCGDNDVGVTTNALRRPTCVCKCFAHHLSIVWAGGVRLYFPRACHYQTDSIVIKER